MNSKKVKWLKSIAQTLPPAVSDRWFVKTGEELIALGYKNDSDGNPFSKEKRYKVMEPVPADHLENLKNEFRKGGVTAVNNYVQYAKQFSMPDQKTESEYPKWFNMDCIHEIDQDTVYYITHSPMPIESGNFTVFVNSVSRYMGREFEFYSMKNNKHSVTYIFKTIK